MGASTLAGAIDALAGLELAAVLAFSAAVALAVLYFAAKYHHQREVDRSPGVSGSPLFGWAGVLAATGGCAGFFLWGAVLFVRAQRPPPGSLEVYVVGRQWLWKVQHPNGKQEINELHVPVGRPVRLLMTSQDVIHGFYIPAFRMKMDVVPGRFTQAWFQALRPGVYRIFCSQYCGTFHAAMRGSVTALTPPDYQQWLQGESAEEAPAAPAVSPAGPGGENPAVQGEKLFNQLGCATCHQSQPGGLGPVLNGLFDSKVPLEDGRTVTADEDYIRESILAPAAKIVKGFQPVMPAFQGQINEAQLEQLVAYIKSLKAPVPAPAPPSAAAAPTAPPSPGKALFEAKGCGTCHQSQPGGLGPVLTDLFGSKVPLEDGRTVTADEDYIRESILAPAAKIVKGFQPVMPPFEGQLSDQELKDLISYIKSLRSEK